MEMRGNMELQKPVSQLKLLLCPFCGKRPHLIEPDDGDFKWSVSCLHCVAIDMQDISKEGVVEKWNRRHYPPEIEKAVERMKPKKVIPEKVYFAPKNRGAYFIRFLCPTCRGIANRATNREFCNNNGCGQALDWSE